MDVPGLPLATNLIPRGLTQRYSVSQANFIEHADESKSENHDQCVISRSLSPCPSSFPAQVLAVDQMWYLMFSSYGRQNAPRLLPTAGRHDCFYTPETLSIAL